MINPHQPLVEPFVPNSISLASFVGPLPELVVELFQSGLNQKRILPLRQTMFAKQAFDSTSRYTNHAGALVLILIAFELNPETMFRLVKDKGTWPWSPTQLVELNLHDPSSMGDTLSAFAGSVPS